MIVTTNNFTDDEIDKIINENVKKRMKTFLLRSVCKFGNVQKVHQFIEDKGMSQFDYDYGLYYACIDENVPIIDLMLACGATSEEPFPQEYIEYKQAQALKFTKLHSDLISMILKF